MKFLILDVYPNDDWRLVKDTAGGYGTGNDFGNSFFSKLINKFVSKMIAMPPMYAIYVYSIIKSKGHQVNYSRDVNDNDKILEADYVVMPTSIIAHETEKKILHLLSKKNKKIFLIGIFSNVMKKEYDVPNSYIVPGEPENFFLNLNYNKNELDSYFKEGSSQRNSSNGMVSNIDELPFPDWGDYVKSYPLKNNFVGFNSKIAIPLLATRGCPYSCFHYCTYPLQQGRKIRHRSVENIIKEMKYWIENLKTNKFIFRDPVFSIDRRHTVSLCEAIIKENLKIEFLIETHLKNLDDELIGLLKQAGLKMVYVGIESSDGNVLKDINRFTVTNDQQYQVIEKLSKNGIYVKSMFMFGNPEDTEETIKKTIQYSKFLPNQLVQFSVFTPYPGTPVYNEFKNKIVLHKLEKYNQYNLVYKHNSLDNDIITKLKNLGYRKFYSDFKNFFVIFLSFASFFRK
tara:strand:+ start:80 stop:1447 length:1368 start_codon:yes stop_codon:yes gene_type:complete